MPGLEHGVTTRAGGVSAGAYASLNVGGSTADVRDAVLENRRRAAAAVGAARLVTPHQVHGTAVGHVRTPADRPGRVDAVVVTARGVAVGVLGADCPGVLLVVPAGRALALVHAGWRGVAGGVVAAAVVALARETGASPEAFLAGIGPGIGPGRYEVDEEVAGRIAAAVPPEARPAVVRPGRPGRAHADLVAALEAQLRAAGLAPEAIARHGACTHADPRFFSHRRDAGVTGRHALVACWSED